MTRERGSYGPLDHDRHFVVGWGSDQLVGYARDRTVGAALRPVLPAVSIASRTNRAVNRLRMAGQIGGRDEAQKPLHVVGQEFFHTVADRQRAIATLSSYFKAFASDLAVWHEANRAAANATSSAQWLDADVTPTLDEWRAFVEHESKSWWIKAATSWDTFEEWWDKLRTLRALARAHGILLQSAEPVPLPKTVWQRGASGKGNGMTAMLGIVKIGVFTAISLAGAISLYSIVQDMRRRAAERPPKA